MSGKSCQLEGAAAADQTLGGKAVNPEGLLTKPRGGESLVVGGGGSREGGKWKENSGLLGGCGSVLGILILQGHKVVGVLAH